MHVKGWKVSTIDEILSAILPESLHDTPPTSFSVVGHIAHLNLRDEYLPFRFIIGQVLLDKNPNLDLIVNKLQSVETKFRTFPMEVLARRHQDRDPSFIVEQLESGCRFRFDFSKVYWNSRLHHEHERLVALFAKGEAIADVFAGVGPFAVPAGKKPGVFVLANDLNPDSYQSLVENIKINKVSKAVKAFNLDGMTFIQNSITLLHQAIATTPTLTINTSSAKRKSRSKDDTNTSPLHNIPIPRFFNHYVMNLPATAISFLAAFQGLYRPYEQEFSESHAKLPQIHVHAFTKEKTDEAAVQDLCTRASEAMGGVLDPSLVHLHWVRNVAPNKASSILSGCRDIGWHD